MYNVSPFRAVFKPRTVREGSTACYVKQKGRGKPQLMTGKSPASPIPTSYKYHREKVLLFMPQIITLVSS
jgi:hypothetical protein